MKSFATLLALLIMIVSFQNCGSDLQPALDNSAENFSNEESEVPTPTDPQCEMNTHFESGVCVPNKRICPVTNGTADQTWNGTAYGICTVIMCNAGYSNQSNSCVFSPMSCPIANGNGQTQTNGACLLVSCNPNFHVNGNSCRSNTQACPVANGVGESTWNGTNFGACTITTCNPGYERMGNTCVAMNTGGNSTTWMPRSSSRFFLTGHSLTDDPLADYISDIAMKRGDSVAYNEQIVIGSPIRVRTRGGGSTGWAGYSTGKNRNGSSGLNIISEIRNPQTIGAGQRYDTLVVAENHNSIDMITWENTVGYLRHYHDLLISGNPNARTFFYNTWLDINKSDPAQWIDHEKKALVAWECAASKVNLSLEAAGRVDRVLNLPIGAGLVDLVERISTNQVPGFNGTIDQKLNMIFGDNVHLTTLGVYYASLLTYSSVYGKSPAGTTPPSGINSTIATALQSIAWNFINSYYNRNNPGSRTMTECRSLISQQLCATYWTMKGRQNQITSCQSFFADPNASPFRWPDTSFPLPAP